MGEKSEQGAQFWKGSSGKDLGHLARQEECSSEVRGAQILKLVTPENGVGP